MPLGVGRITMETTPNVIADSSQRHLLQGCQRHTEGELAKILRSRTSSRVVEEEVDRGMRRELRRAAESSVLLIKVRGQRLYPVRKELLVEWRRRSRRSPRDRFDQAVRELSGVLFDLRPFRFPEMGDLTADRQESGLLASILARKIGSGEDRLLVGRQENRHGPAAAPARKLNGRHVRLVHIGPLFPVDLDAHEGLVKDRCNIVPLEGLVLHNMAPVAARVADAEKDWLILGVSLRESLAPPGKPIHRIVLVLKQIGRRLARKAIRHMSSLESLRALRP